MSRSQQLGENLLLQSHPLKLLGITMGRNVSVIRLESGRTIIHSTAEFSEADIDEIRNFGEPGWLLDATNFHDTMSEAGQRAFPDLPYLVPEGFPAEASPRLSRLSVTSPEEWNGEIAVIPLEGMPKINEFVFVHHSSNTLIVADLFFNHPPDIDSWTRNGLRFLSGIKQFPGISRLFRKMIKDREAFEQSLRRIFQFDFDQIIVAHGDPVLTNGKEILRDVLTREGFHI